jgi:serine/threonine-protein kinase
LIKFMAHKNKNIDDLLDDKPIILKSLMKAGVALGLIALFLGVVAFVSFDWAFSALVHSRKEVKVPDITKKSIYVALDSLEEGNLALRKAGEEFQPELPAGSIIRQLPPAGTLVREGKVVRVWISQGTESISVPEVTGLTLRNAELTIRQSYLSVGKKETGYSLTVEKGSVISQDPAAKELLTKGQPVNLVVSGGTPPSSMRLMPDFRQKKLADVNLWASDANIDVQIDEDRNSMFPNGTIVKQSPEPDSEVAPGSSIKITVSTRPAAEGEKMHRIHYELPQGKDANRVKIVVEDSIGQREVLNEMKQPGSKIDVNIPYGGSATFRIYVDGILVREKEMK